MKKAKVDIRMNVSPQEMSEAVEALEDVERQLFAQMRGLHRVAKAKTKAMRQMMRDLDNYRCPHCGKKVGDPPVSGRRSASVGG